MTRFSAAFASVRPLRYALLTVLSMVCLTFGNREVAALEIVVVPARRPGIAPLNISDFFEHSVYKNGLALNAAGDVAQPGSNTLVPKEPASISGLDRDLARNHWIVQVNNRGQVDWVDFHVSSIGTGCVPEQLQSSLHISDFPSPDHIGGFSSLRANL